jgi:hypothetical protein
MHDLFVPTAHSLSLLEQPTEPSPIYAYRRLCCFGGIFSCGFARYHPDTRHGSRPRGVIRSASNNEVA